MKFSSTNTGFKSVYAIIILVALAIASNVLAENTAHWKKHTVVEQGHCNTAVALDANGDKNLDVIASFNGKVSLFIAPDWKEEIVLHRFANAAGGCIHSTVLDADGDGDLDWAGALASAHPFWLENPG